MPENLEIELCYRIFITNERAQAVFLTRNELTGDTLTLRTHLTSSSA